MKSIGIALVCLYMSLSSYGQEILNSTGHFGEKISKKGAVSVKKLPEKVENSNTVEIKVKGIVAEVCQVSGCWMTMDIGDDERMRVKFKDYGFFVPKDAAGKTAIIRGIAKKETISIDELKHLAEDAGKSEKEINSIKEPEEALTFVADGVIIK
ncbi:MAG: DUF4920 domain-containing protein [Cytophagales bacterium]|nr:DUF4920 domain-containing protein [Cytophagales bacterium]